MKFILFQGNLKAHSRKCDSTPTALPLQHILSDELKISLNWSKQFMSQFDRDLIRAEIADSKTIPINVPHTDPTLHTKLASNRNLKRVINIIIPRYIATLL